MRLSPTYSTRILLQKPTHYTDFRCGAVWEAAFIRDFMCMRWYFINSECMRRLTPRFPDVCRSAQRKTIVEIGSDEVIGVNDEGCVKSSV